MGQMSQQELLCLNADNGATSEVTYREATGDKSVTVDKFEKSVLATKYPLDSFTRAGGVAPDGKQDKFMFNVFDMKTQQYSAHEIAIKYPKSTGYELRLYFNRASGFYPDVGYTWFIFTRAGENLPFIGCVPTGTFTNFTSTNVQQKAYEVNAAIDDVDEEFVRAVMSPEAQKEAVGRQIVVHNRNAATAAKVIKAAQYKCQVDTDHNTFVSASTGQSFVEAHHLVPVAKSPDFDVSLDVEPNIVVLCPNCHRAIHYAEPEHKKVLLSRFYDERSDLLAQCGIVLTIEQLFKYYGID